jgi:uncharacterized glyoxalase superfamily protein PhnB
VVIENYFSITEQEDDMKPTPPDWPRISSSAYYQDPALCEAFGFEVRMKIEGEAGEIVHSELEFGEGLIMVGGEGGWSSNPTRKFAKSPKSLGGQNTQSMMVHVDDIDAHFARAKAAGAVMLNEPYVSDYGADYWADRGYACEDLEGHTWYFAQRMMTKGQPA